MASNQVSRTWKSSIFCSLVRADISPLIAEQLNDEKMTVRTTKKGERVLMDPAITISRVFLYFYLMINVGSLVGQVGMVFAEKYVGFWLSFVLPTAMFFFCPMVLYLCRNKYNFTKPSGSVTMKALRLWKMAMSPYWSWNIGKMSEAPLKISGNFY